MIRRPKSASEMLWGGWTCTNCGCKVDKYGKERASTYGVSNAAHQNRDVPKDK